MLENEEQRVKSIHEAYGRAGVTAEVVAAFQSFVRDYYRQEGRDFSWRRTRDPYEILVSEVMLQQTPTGRVEKKYPLFLQAFPTVQDLADAEFDDVLSLWSGLGYNRRAKALKRSAELIVDEHDGEMPRHTDELMELPGVGRSTASGVMAFAYDEPVVFVEVNIRRVFIYFFFPEQNKVRDSEMLPLVEKMLDRENPRDWYYGLMDYGVTLKERHRHLHRKSARYRKQARFEGSDRQIRGQILRLLLDNESASGKEIRQSLDAESDRVKENLANLVEEGMIREHEGDYSVS